MLSLLLIACSILATALAVYIAHRALTYFVNRVPTELDIPVTVDELSPDYVAAVPTPEPVHDARDDRDTIWLIAECYGCEYVRHFRSTEYEPKCNLCHQRWSCTSREDGFGKGAA